MDRPGSPFGTPAGPYGSLAASSATVPCSPYSSVSAPMAFGSSALVPYGYGSPGGSINAPLQGNYAYPSSPPSCLRHYDIGIPSSPARPGIRSPPRGSPPGSQGARDALSRSP